MVSCVNLLTVIHDFISFVEHFNNVGWGNGITNQ